MNYLRFSAIFGALLVIWSCGKNDLEGAWVGYSIQQGDSTFIHAKAEQCSLFLGEEYYFFRGNTGAIEKGIYTQGDDYISLEDTLRSANAKKIAYDLKSLDTLELTMNKNGEALILNMRRNQKSQE